MLRIAVLIALLLASPASGQTVTAEALVDGLEGVSGPHAGKRRAHAKGFCATGAFVSSGAGAALTVASTLAPGARLPAVFRFSLAPPDPAAADHRNTVRGMAFALALPGGGSHHFALLNSPVFLARDPETFLGLLGVVRPDPKTGQPDIGRFLDYLDAHPDLRPHMEFANATPPAASYAADRYFGIHSFLFRNAAGEERAARWFFEPADGRVGLSRAAADALGPDFLYAELRARVALAPVAWSVWLQPAAPDDPIDDPSREWPSQGRARVEVGRLTVDAVGPAENDACDGMMFDPLKLPAGIAPSADPVLRMRTRAYEVSLERRGSVPAR